MIVHFVDIGGIVDHHCLEVIVCSVDASLITSRGKLHMINFVSGFFEGFLKYEWVRVMMFNTTFNNLSALLVEETRVPRETNELPPVTDNLYHLL